MAGFLESLGFEKNPYDICVMNKIVNGKQISIGIFVDNLILSGVNRNDVKDIINKIQEKFEKITLNDGNIHDYLGMTIDFSHDNKVIISMTAFIESILNDSGIKHQISATPARNNLFDIDPESPILTHDKKDYFHSMTMRLFYLAKRVRPDILLAATFLSTRIANPTVQDISKLDRVLSYLNGSKELNLVFNCSDSIEVVAFVDASFGIHNDMKSHTGSVIKLGGNPIHVKSSKQKLNSKSSTESELIAVSESLPQVIWTKNFIESQGYYDSIPKLFQDNQSTIAMIQNGRPVSEATRHIHIRFFFVHDRVMKGEINLQYIETGSMLADIFTKPLQGELFTKMRDRLLGLHHLK
jgi:hypothetical protein